MKLVLLGAPGAGKGTQADILCGEYNIPTISTGSILREAVKNGTPVGLKAKEFMDSGALVPDEVIIGIVKERLEQPDCEAGYILDGMPRTINQAQALEDGGVEIDAALSLEVLDETIVERMTGRRVCGECGAVYHVVSNPPETDGVCNACSGELKLRADDAPETVKQRLHIYHEQTEPLKDFYKSRGKLLLVEGRETIEETSREVKKALGL
ncbi:MAG: adenylate kinase [Oscillospiraceae bacterium]|jgi:adenylate kinase|nr:adenylate kinase [Oscillospiraceae bacterium]